MATDPVSETTGWPRRMSEPNLKICPLCGEDVHDGDGNKNGEAHWWCATLKEYGHE